MDNIKQKIDILAHTLGNGERNYFVADQGHSDMPTLLQLESDGFMGRMATPSFLPNNDLVFYVTRAGKIWLEENRPKPPRITRDQKRYIRFLHLHDVWPDLTFKEFVNSPELYDNL